MIEIKSKKDLEKMSKDEIIEEFIKQQDKLVKTDKELRKHKNPNTPPSSNKHLKPNTQGLKNKAHAKRGAPFGHKGVTRQRVPTRFEVVDTNYCPHCGGNHLKTVKTFKRVIDEIPEPVIPEVVETIIHKKHCLDCDHIFIPEHNTTPLKGNIGINTMVLVLLMRFILRGVLRKSVSFLDSSFAFKLTPATVNAIIKRASDAAQKDYEKLKYQIRNSDKVYVDETSFSVLGKNQWVWVFRTKQDILLIIRPSRGSNVLEEILGKDYPGTVICDCWRAYNFLSKAHLQRCWAHLLRKSDALESIPGKHFHEKLSTLFKEIKEFNTEKHTIEERQKKYTQLTNELDKLITYYRRYDELVPVVKYVNFNLTNWFTCVKIKDIEPTNNFAEQAIRETVMIRKIIGAFRSEKGKQNYETLASLIATWNLTNQNPKTELKHMLTQNLCFS